MFKRVSEMHITAALNLRTAIVVQLAIVKDGSNYKMDFNDN